MLVIGVVSFLVAADNIRETNVTPNPNMLRNVVEGDGTFSVDAGNTFQMVQFTAELTTSNPKQDTVVQAATDRTVNPNTWKANNVQVVAGNYDCWGTLITKVNTTGLLHITISNTINVQVN
jgi:hypothetical protein